MTSYHAILGCAVIDMGVALMPRIVLESFADRDRLAVSSPGPELDRARTLFVSRRGERRGAVAALAELLSTMQKGVVAA